MSNVKYKTPKEQKEKERNRRKMREQRQLTISQQKTLAKLETDPRDWIVVRWHLGARGPVLRQRGKFSEWIITRSGKLVPIQEKPYQ